MVLLLPPSIPSFHEEDRQGDTRSRRDGAVKSPMQDVISDPSNTASVKPEGKREKQGRR